LSGNDNICNEADYVANNIPFLSKRLKLFVASIDISLFSGAGTIFDRDGSENITLFCFNIAGICINQKCSMAVGSLHILQSLNLNGGLGVEAPVFGDLGDLLPK